MIITRAPFRLTLGGGGTDLPSFYEKNGGLVVTMALNKYIYVTFKKNLLEPKVRLQYLKTEFVNNAAELTHERARESLLLHGLTNGVEISSVADLPAQAGLGSSGSYLVALLRALRVFNGKPLEPRVVAEEACNLEINILKQPVGKQDQYISAFGGLRILDINRKGKVKVKNINISKNDIQDFLSSVHLYYTGVLRSASDILKEQSQLNPTTEDNLKKIKDIGYEVIEILGDKKFDEFGLLMDKHWKFKKQLSSKISLSQVDYLYDEVKERFGVLGGKIAGAGGGGFLMLYCPHHGSKLENFMSANNLPRINYDIDSFGCQTLVAE